MTWAAGGDMSKNLKTALVYASIAVAIFVGFIAKIWLLGR